MGLKICTNMKLQSGLTNSFFGQFQTPFLADGFYDLLQDTVYFVKDIQGRYMAVNQTLVDRCGQKHKQDLIGRTVSEVFPATLGQRFAEQDAAVLRTGRPVQKALELHLYPDGSEGWCLTWKQPLRNAKEEIIGLVGISRDTNPPVPTQADHERVTRVVNHVRQSIDKPLRATNLARLAGFSPYQLDRRLKAAFGLSVRELIAHERVNRACTLLKTSRNPISQVALECGYADQAAFTRNFRKLVGMTPSAYLKASSPIPSRSELRASPVGSGKRPGESN